MEIKMNFYTYKKELSLWHVYAQKEIKKKDLAGFIELFHELWPDFF